MLSVGVGDCRDQPWRRGKAQLSGQTMDEVAKPFRSVRIDVELSAQGFTQLDGVLDQRNMPMFLPTFPSAS
jgi:hypothetical protein